MATEKTTPVNIETLIGQQQEMQKTLRDKRKEVKEIESKNRELKSQIGATLNLPKGVSVVIRKAV